MHIEKKTIRNLFIGAACCIFLYWLLHETERVQAVFCGIGDMLSPFVIGACLAFILNVPMRSVEGLLKGMKNEKMRRLVSIVLTFICVLLVLTLVFVALIPQLIDTVQSLIPKVNDFLLQAENRIVDFLNDNQSVVDWSITFAETLDIEGLSKKLLDLVGDSAETILSGTFSALAKLLGGIVDVVIAIVFALYCLFQKETLARQGRKIVYAFLPEHVADTAVRILRLANSTFSNFLSGQCIEVCILGCLFAITMAIFRMPYILLVSVLVAVTAFVPVVGAWIGCVLGTFFIFVSDPMQAVWFVVMFLVLQQIENNMIYPRVVGTSIGLSGMWVLVAVAVGGELMGVAGMFLMIPVASVVYSVLSEYTNKRLVSREIEPEKLKEQPPELRSKFKEIRQKKRKKIEVPESEPQDEK